MEKEVADFITFMDEESNFISRISSLVHKHKSQGLNSIPIRLLKKDESGKIEHENTSLGELTNRLHSILRSRQMNLPMVNFIEEIMDLPTRTNENWRHEARKTKGIEINSAMAIKLSEEILGFQ